MKLYAKLGGLSLLILTSVALICYSPISKSIYEDWKKDRSKSKEERRISSLVTQNSGVKNFTKEGGSLIASQLSVQLKLLSEDQVGVIVTLFPTHPVRATKYDAYTFTLLLEDKDGFDLREIIVNEWEMTGILDEDLILDSLTFESRISIPVQQYAQIADLQILYQSSPGRKALYEQLRELTPAEIVENRKQKEEEALAAKRERLANLAKIAENRKQEEEEARAAKLDRAAKAVQDAEASYRKSLVDLAVAREKAQKKAQKEAAESERLRKEEMARTARILAEEQRKKLEEKEKRAAAWSQIKIGISRPRVEELLGPPEQVSAYSSMTVLNYEGLSSVKISRSGVVEAYKTP